MAKLDQIAEQLGISPATVSRALNNKPGVSAQMREQVLDLARQLNYAPSLAGRSLVTQRTDTVGFLTFERSTPLAGDPFYYHILRGVEQELAQLGYFMIVSTVYPGMQEASSLQLVTEKRVDGLIIAGPFFPRPLILSLHKAGVPIVLVDNTVSKPPLDAVLVEDEEAGYEATQHLIAAHHHRHIVALSGPKVWPSNRARVSGYRWAMEDAGLEPRMVRMDDTTIDTGYRALRQALEQHPETTAIFAINDAMAMGALRAAQDMGRNLPGDLAIVGFDDVVAAAHVCPSLTTMRVPKRQLGALAARRLIERLRQENSDTEAAVVSMVNAELVLRASCGCEEKP